MSWKKALGYGVLIWIVMFVVVSIFVGYGMVASGGGSATFSILMIVLALILTYVAARMVAPMNSGKAMQYGLTFAVVGIVLDFLISQRFAPGMFSSVYYWISYILMVFVPVIAVKKMPMSAPQQQG
jgi:hypothetical protein